MNPGMQISLQLVMLLVVVALFFDFLNGFHDAANSIATVVSTGVLKPQHAVLWASAFNVIAVMVFPLTVAATMVAFFYGFAGRAPDLSQGASPGDEL